MKIIRNFNKLASAIEITLNVSLFCPNFDELSRLFSYCIIFAEICFERDSLFSLFWTNSELSNSLPGMIVF